MKFPTFVPTPQLWHLYIRLFSFAKIYPRALSKLVLESPQKGQLILNKLSPFCLKFLSRDETNLMYFVSV